MEYSLEMSIEQKQILSQQQIQSLNLLAMNSYELNLFLTKEELENPVLERKQQEEIKYYENIGNWMKKRENGRESRDKGETDMGYNEISQEEIFDVYQYVYEQIDWTAIDGKDSEKIENILKCMDQHGFIPMTGEELCQACHISMSERNKFLKMIQKTEPVGIGAFDFKEALILQLRRKGYYEPKAEKIVLEYLEEVAAGHFHKIAQQLNVKTEEVRQWVSWIKGLNPIPLNGMEQGKAEYKIPDIIIRKEKNEWKIEINDKWVGTVGVSTLYEKLVKNIGDKETVSYLLEKIKRTNYIVQCIEQRRKTIYAIVSLLCRVQEDFLSGTGKQKLYSQKDAAKDLGISESTISRTVRDKLLDTPGGIMEMQHLFLKTGKDVKEELLCIIREEDKKKPVSDQKITEMLGKAGFSVSRRTVAKYREELNIGGIYERRIVD